MSEWMVASQGNTILVIAIAAIVFGVLAWLVTRGTGVAPRQRA
ncbi:MAG: hypothetical protein AB7P03_29800 [Kofleriaceae bacterium]